MNTTARLDLEPDELAAMKAAVLELLVADCEALDGDPNLAGDVDASRREFVAARAVTLELLTRKLRDA